MYITDIISRPITCTTLSSFTLDKNPLMRFSFYSAVEPPTSCGIENA